LGWVVLTAEQMESVLRLEEQIGCDPYSGRLNMRGSARFSMPPLQPKPASKDAPGITIRFNIVESPEGGIDVIQLP
jgi:hypothetical protein